MRDLAVFTAIIQSSAAAVGILQALSLTGTLSAGETFPLLLGIGVGGALPVLLGALGANRNGVRTAVAHLLIDILGAVICGAGFYALNAVHPFAFLGGSISIVGVAAMNTAFRLVTVVALAPFIGLLEKLTNLFVRDAGQPAAEAPENEIRLEERLLLGDYSEEGFRKVRDLECLVDRYEDALGSYLLRITPTELTQEQNKSLHKFLHAITDFERISDHANNIADSAKEIFDKQLEFSQASQHELDVLAAAVKEIVDLTISAFVDNDLELALQVEPLEELIDGLCDQMRSRHIDRLQMGISTQQHSFVFNDLMTNYERVGDHCSNVAVAMIELAHDVFDMHEYLDSRKLIRDAAFDENYERFRAKFNIE